MAPPLDFSGIPVPWVLDRKPHLGHQPEFGGLLWVRKAGCQGQQPWLHLGWASVADFALEIWGALAFWEVLGAAVEGAQGDRDTVGATCAILPEVRTLHSQYRESSAWLVSRVAGKGFPCMSVKGLRSWPPLHGSLEP